MMSHDRASRLHRSGHTLPELMVALTLFGLLSICAASVLRSHTRLAHRAVDRAERADALRVATLVLGAETRFLRADRDVLAAADDSIALRAYRGLATICASAGNVGYVRYAGVRDPNPEKDSVLILRGDTLEFAAGLRGASVSDGCTTGANQSRDAAANEQGWRLELTRTVVPGDILLLFEPGTYYLTGSALRYRIGAEGRQPITTERLDDRSTRFEAIQPGAMRLSLATRPLPAIGEREHVRVRVPMLNQEPR